MPRYKCVNKECPQADKEVVVASMRYRYDPVTESMVPFEPIRCKDCGKDLEYIPDESPATCNIGKFSSMSQSEKRAAVSKRSKDHFAKNDKGDLANYKKTITDKIRNQALGNV